MLIAFPLEQWLHESASMLRHTYLACVVQVHWRRYLRPTERRSK